MKRWIKSFVAMLVAPVIATGMMRALSARKAQQHALALMIPLTLIGVALALRLLGSVLLRLFTMGDLAPWFRRKHRGKAPAAGTEQPDDLHQDSSACAV